MPVTKNSNSNTSHLFEVSIIDKGDKYSETKMVARGCREEWGMTANGHEVSFRGDETILELDW